MAIDWSEDISSGAPVKKSNLAEIKTEMDGIADYVSLDLTWDYFVDDGSSSDGDPIDDAIKTEQPQELRDNTETLDANKHSVAEDGHDSSVDDTAHSGNEWDYDSSVNDGYNCGSYDSAEDYEFDSTL